MALIDKLKGNDGRKPKSEAPKAKKATSSKKGKDAKTSAKANRSGAASHVLGVIRRPHVTEKASTLASEGKYVFAVDPQASRIEVRNAVKSLYGVLPVSVNIQNVKGKAVRFGRREGRRQDWKKAIVTLPEGKTIDVYEGV